MVLERDGGVCQIDGPRCTEAATEVDHVIARADGGPLFDPRNLRAACKACNGYQSAKRTNERRKGSRFYRTGVTDYEVRL